MTKVGCKVKALVNHEAEARLPKILEAEAEASTPKKPMSGFKPGFLWFNSGLTL